MKIARKKSNRLITLVSVETELPLCAKSLCANLSIMNSLINVLKLEATPRRSYSSVYAENGGHALFSFMILPDLDA